MDLSVGKELLTEMICGNNLAYVINEDHILLPMEYKVLQSQPGNTFVRCMKLLFNGKVQLYYLTNGLKSFQDILPLLNPGNFIKVVENLFSSILDVQNNGFLSCQNIDVSFRHVFVDPTTYNVSLVYLPITKKLYHDLSEFENTVRSNLIKVIRAFPSLTSPKIMQLSADLSSGIMSFESVYTNLKNGVVVLQKKGTGFDNSSYHGDRESGTSGKLRLVALNTPVAFQIVVSKSEFVLGRKQEMVDGVIPFSQMIGRIHCKIVKNGNQYGIVDLNSSNGTYLNGVRLQPDRVYSIQNSDIIQLASSKFQVIIGV